MTDIEYTHKGWFGVCPVFLAEIDSDGPIMDPRHWSLVPLFWFSEILMAFVVFCTSAMNPEWEPVWPIRITGEIGS